jgi:hypothetical protein
MFYSFLKEQSRWFGSLFSLGFTKFVKGLPPALFGGFGGHPPAGR